MLFLAKGRLGSKGVKLDRDALVEIIKNIKRNTKLSDEDAAVIAASKVNMFSVFILHLHESKITLLLCAISRIVMIGMYDHVWYRPL